MAKKKPLPEFTITNSDHDYTVGDSRESANYLYAQDYTAGAVSFNRSPKDDIPTSSYNGISAAYKNGDDLVVIQKLYNSDSDHTVKKTVTSTVKEFFTSEKATTVTLDAGEENWSISKTSTPGTVQGLYAYNAKDDSNSVKYLMGTNKANKFTLKNQGSTVVYDEKGNDSYTYEKIGSYGTTYDFAGNDKYNLNVAATLTSEDWAGNDKYTLKNEGTLYAKDYAGNDKYSTVTANLLQISDYAGKDAYNIKSADELTITDHKGKDKYTLFETAKVKITDLEADADTYKLTNVSADSNIGTDDLLDYGGNDKYTLSGVTNAKENSAFRVEDVAGKDTYTITGENNLTISDGYHLTSSNMSGNDTYKMTDTKGVTIYDNGGKNKFTVKNSDSITIRTTYADSGETVYDDTYNVSGTKGKKGKADTLCKEIQIFDIHTASKDTYNLSYVEGSGSLNDNEANIYDNGGSDKFTLKNTKNVSIDFQEADSGTSVVNTISVSNSENFVVRGNYKGSGNTSDVYNITSSSGTINDYKAGNETYKVNKLDGSLMITDHGGNDSLTITGAKEKNLVYMASAYSSGSTSNLYVYDKVNKGFVILGNYFSVATDPDPAKRVLSDVLDYRIETIKAGKTNVTEKDGAFMYAAYFESDALKAEVAGFLGGKSMSMSQIFDASNETRDNDVAQLAAIFEQYQQPTA